MNFLRRAIPDVIRLEPRVFLDTRGFFMETFLADRMASTDISGHFVQENHPGSYKNIIRGLHYQLHHAQDKPVRVVRDGDYLRLKILTYMLPQI